MDILCRLGPASKDERGPGVSPEIEIKLRMQSSANPI